MSRIEKSIIRDIKEGLQLGLGDLGENGGVTSKVSLGNDENSLKSELTVAQLFYKKKLESINSMV